MNCHTCHKKVHNSKYNDWMNTFTKPYKVGNFILCHSCYSHLYEDTLEYLQDTKDEMPNENEIQNAMISILQIDK